VLKTIMPKQEPKDVLADANKSVNVISKKAAGTSGPNTSVIALGETPPLPGNRRNVLADADKSVDDIS
jgi:hypothetical protein